MESDPVHLANQAETLTKPAVSIPTCQSEQDAAVLTKTHLQSSSINGKSGVSLGLMHDNNQMDKLMPDIEELQKLIAVMIDWPEEVKVQFGDTSEGINSGALLALGIRWDTHFKRSGEIESLNKAIKWYSRATLVLPSGHVDKPGRLNCLSDLYMCRFHHLGDLADIDKTIALQSHAVSLTHMAEPDMLSYLGQSYECRFKRSGDLGDIDKAITCHSQAVSLTPESHETRPGVLTDLGGSHMFRFQHLGDLVDIEKAIELQSLALSLIPASHPSKSSYLGNLGNSHMLRFKHVGNLADIDKAIEFLAQAIALTPGSYKDRPGMLNSLGSSYILRFEHLGDLADIETAIEHLSQEVLHTSDNHSGSAMILCSLGLSYTRRFERLGDLADIDKAIACQSQAISLTPEDHADRPGRLSNLGNSHMHRFEHLGNLEDISKAIEYLSQAFMLTPEGHIDKPTRLNNLGNSHLCRFQHLDDLGDINKAIAYYSQAVSLIPDSHEKKSSMLNNLGVSHMCQFERLGDLAAIDKAISFQSQAVFLTPDGHAEKPGRLSNLGGSHMHRFEHLGDLEDIDQAINYQSQTVLVTLDGHADKSGWLDNLGNSHRRRFEHLGDLADISKAIAYHSQAVSLTPDNHSDKPHTLNNLGDSHARRFEHFGDLADLDQAIACQSRSVLLSPDGHARRPSRLMSLGNSYWSRFQHLSDLADINKAIADQSLAISLTPDGHTDKPEYLNNLGQSYLKRFEHLGNTADRHELISILRKSAHCPTGKLITRFKASRGWAMMSAHVDRLSSLSAYQWTVDMVPKIVWIGSTISRRHEHTRSIGDLAVEAASVAISEQQYGLALEWLEAGRSIVWSQTLQLRTSFDDLSTVDPDLAKSLRNAAIALEHAGSRSSNSTSLTDPHTLEAAAQKHRRLAEDFDIFLDRARQLPGFQNFMRPKKSIELVPAAQSGPVVVVNVHKSRCDALILRPRTDDIMHVPLPDVSDTKIMDLQYQMREFASRGAPERRPQFHPEEPERPLESLLSTLWHKIVKPVIISLGYVEKLPVDQLPHITWCTTGALSMLPIHAAGCYDETNDNLFSYAISSYAPTLSSLLSSETQSLELGKVLAVSQEATLPATKQELSHIQQHAGAAQYLQLENHEATADAVLDAMERFSSVHLACHASQNLSKPLESCFHLHDRGLTLEDITKRSLKDKGLAFLSACQTATGDEKSPDEAIHLAAGMLVVGYPTVIATMWAIKDSDAPLVADSVYGQLVEEGKLGDGRVARALHVAVAALRDHVGEKEFVRWVPYIHMGI